MLSEETRKALIGWEFLGCRIIKVSFEIEKKITIKLIQCGALTNDINDHDEEQFLQAAVDHI